MMPTKDSLSPYIDSFPVDGQRGEGPGEKYHRGLQPRSAPARRIFLSSRRLPPGAKSTTVSSSLLSCRAPARHGLSPTQHRAPCGDPAAAVIVFSKPKALSTKIRCRRLFTGAGPRKLPQTLSAADIRKLSTSPIANEALGARDQAMLELLYATGLRVSELVAFCRPSKSISKAII